MPDCVLEISEVSVEHRLAPFSARLCAGEQIHLVGPNGSGKSTLLARLAGMLGGAGEVRLNGERLETYPGRTLAQHRAYLCQQLPPIAMMPVFQYLSLHQPAGCDPELLVQTISFLCQRLALNDKLARILTHLSGGEWQRVRVAAAFLQVWPALNPQGRLLLLDEPASGLDVAQKAALETLIAQFCASGRSVIMSAHDLNHTLQQADRVWLLADGRSIAQGKPLQVMTPEILSAVFHVDFYRQSIDGQHWIMTKSRVF